MPSRSRGQAALPVQRLGGPPAGGPLDARAGQPDRQAVPALADPFGEDRDRHVGVARAHRFGERTGRARGFAQVRVEEQQMPGAVRVGRGIGGFQQPDGLGPGLHRRRLAPVTAVPQHRGPGVTGSRGGVVGRAVVDHDDQVDPGQPGGAGHGGLDAVGLVPGWNDDCDVPARLPIPLHWHAPDTRAPGTQDAGGR